MDDPSHHPPPEALMYHDGERRWAWAKLNAYGFVLAALAILALADLIDPAGTDLARMAGEIPAGQTWWIGGLGVAGVLLLVGFLRTDRLAEAAGLVLLTVAVLAQTVAAWALLGWTDYTWTRLGILGILTACTYARITVLWSRDGLAVSIPPRGVKRGRR